MKVHGTQTQLCDALRKQINTQCKGKLCVRRNGQTAKTRQFTVLTGFGPNHNLGLYNNSVDTIERAFAERYFLCKDGEGFRPAFKVGPSAFRTEEFSEFSQRVMIHMPSLPVLTSQQVVDTYRGPKQRVYQEALYSLEKDPLTATDAQLSAFVKKEKQDVSKAPRVINPRAARYNLRLGKYIKHAEHHFFTAINHAFGARTSATVIKGFNADRSATILREKWNLFQNPVAVGLDAAKFDMHVTVNALRYEHSFYKSLFPGNKELSKLLSWQLRNKGVARAADGIVKFEMEGTRCSGDLNTSLGNCLLMCAMIWSLCHEMGIDVELANNGDDCVIIMEERDLARFMAPIGPWFKRRGFAMTVEEPVYEFEQIEFCQTHPVELSTGWRMVRNWSACQQKDPMCLIDIPNNRVFRKWLGAVGSCGSTLSAGVPVHTNFYDVFKRNGSEFTLGMLNEIYKNRSQLQMSQGVAQGKVSPSARVSYYYAFGVLPDEQDRMERFFDQLAIEEVNHNATDQHWLSIDPGFNILNIVRE